MTEKQPPTFTRSILAYHRPRVLLAAASAVCFALFWWIAGVLHVPEALHLDPSLATQSSPILSFLLAGILLALCTVIGTLIAGGVRTDAGLFAACAGLGAMAIRFGPAGQVYREADGVGIFIWLATETILFYALVAAGWWISERMHRRRWSVADTIRDGMNPTPFPLTAKILASLTHAAAMVLMLMLLLRSLDKAQSLASIVVAAAVASMIAHSLFGVTPALWMLIGPLLAGVIGFFMGFFSPGSWQTGHPGSALALAAPIDYASAGPVGALLGYWISRKWHAARQHEAIAKNTPPAAISAGS